MTYEVIRTFTARTNEGVREIRPGEVVTLPETAAKRLLEAGSIRPCTPSPDRQDQAPTAKSSRTETMRADDKTVGRRPLPYLDRDGSLIIPFSADPRFHWWAGGQGVEETEREVKQWLM